MRFLRPTLMAAACAVIACESATSPLSSGIGSNGGTATSENSAARVSIPAGALPANMTVTVTPAATVPADPGLVPGAAYEFGPTGTTFAAPVIIAIKYDPANLPANVPESSVKMYTSVNGAWTLVPGSVVDVNTHTVSGSTTHFSLYAAIGTIPVAQLAISPGSASVINGSSIQLSATAQDASGKALAGRTVSWSSADPTRATVSSSGLVTGVAVGTAVITATSEGRSATAVIAVTPVPVATVSLTPPSANLIVGASAAFSATTKDGTGNTLPDRTVTWTSSDATKASVSATGSVTAISAGTATITATSEGKTASAVVTVTQAPVAVVVISPSSATIFVGGTTTLVAATLDANSSPLNGRSVAWSSSDPLIAFVSPTGAVIGVAAGVATVTATSEGKSASARIAVTVQVAGIDIIPSAASVAVGSTLSLTASPRDAAGNFVAGRQPSWFSLNPNVATVSATGVVTGVAVGTASIRASLDGAFSNATVTVTSTAGPAPVSTVSLTPLNASVDVGGTVALVATLRDASSGVLTGRTITWTTSNPAVATVSASGVVTGVMAGAVTVVATSEGKTATAAVTVTTPAAVVASVSITPVSPSIAVGGTQALTATPRDAGAAAITGRAVTWSSSNAAVATVTSTGVVSAVSVGTAIITATVDGVSSTTTVTVTAAAPAAVATVAIPSSGPILVGTAVQFTATLKDASANVLTGRVTTWATSDATIASISSSGFFTALQPGSVTITAASEGKSGSVLLTIIPIPVAAVAVTPASSIVAIGSTAQLLATTTDASSNVLTGRVVLWTSLDASKATVSSSGLVTALSSGTVTIQATSETKVGSATINIPTAAPVATLTLAPATATVNVGSTTTLVATPRDASNNVLTARVITWSSSDVTKATVSSSGVVLSIAAGQVTITATSEGKSATAALTIVVPVAPVAIISVSPTSVNIVAGSSTAPIATTTVDANSNVLVGRVVTWSSLNEAIATVSSTGVITGVAPGSATIVAVSETRSAIVAVTVTSASTPTPVASVVVTPTAASVVLLGTVQFAASTLDANGATLTGRTVSWSTGNTSFATVTSAGVVTARRVGTVSVSATSEGKTGTVTLTITAMPTASVQVTPGNQTGVVGTTIQLSAQVYNSINQVIGDHLVTYSSSNTAVATINSNGLVTGVSAGTAVITATTDDGVSGSTNVTFTAGIAPVFKLTVTPASPTVVTNATLQLDANPTDANNVALTGRVIAWTTTNSAVATVSATGLVTGKAVGTVTIGASSEGKGASTVVTIISPPVATISVTPSPATVTLQHAILLTATLKDANGNTLAGKTVTWSSSDATKASVNSNGTVTAVAVGSVTVTAASEGKTGTTVVNVTVAPVTDVAISPPVTNIGVGETAALTAIVTAFESGTVSGRTVTWSTSDASKVSVSATGVVTGAGVGSATVTATSEGKSGATVVSVAAIAAAANNAVKLQAITTGTKHACGLDTSGAAYCWGSNGNGALGDNSTTNRRTPGAVVGGLTFASISNDQNLSCGITTAGTLYCWGGGSLLTVSNVPVSVAPGITFSSVSANDGHTCAVATDGTGYCIGGNGSGSLGSGASSDALPGSTTFRQVVGGLKWKQISTSNNSTCGIATTGALYCWGSIGSYTSTGSTSASPVLITNAVNFASITHHAGTYIVCGLDTSGAAYCIGSLATEFGASASSTPQTARRVGGTTTFKSLTHYSDTLCGVGSNDALYCWGSGPLGQGASGSSSSTTPLVVLPGRTFSTVDLSDEGSVCAVARDGVGFCWGGNFYGQIGDGTTAGKSVPTALPSTLVFRVP